MPETIIIGGGVIGLGLAYHLAMRGDEDILLLERNQLTSGTSWHAAGIVGPLRATPNMTKLAKYAGELFPRLEEETGMSTGYRETGGYWLARRSERMDELNRIASLGKHFGLTPEILSKSRLDAELPFLNVVDHAGGMSVAEDARVDPVGLCMAYARAAKNGGVTIQEHAEVAKVSTADHRANGVILTDGTKLSASNIVICAGTWSKPIAESAGVSLPLQAVEHMYVVTEPIDGMPETFPVIRDLDSGIYIKGDSGGKLVIGGFEPDAKCWNPFGPEGDREFLELAEDWEQFTPFMEAALELLPALEKAGIQRFMNGPESFTTDTKPMIGEFPEVDSLYVAAGMNSVGIMSSAGIGSVLADWIADGGPPMDLWEVDVARIDPKSASDSHMTARMKEAVSDQFAMHWPFKQPKAGRGLRKSALHDKWAEHGAVFGVTAGWERGLWYAKDETELDLPYSVGEQPWQEIIEREAAEMAHNTVLIDLSPFSKFDITGENALTFLEQLTCSTMDREIGRATYTLILNDEGGIESDITVTRLAQNHFRITSPAVTRWRDKALLRRRSHNYSVAVTDETENKAVIGVMGTGSRELLSTLSDDDWDEFPFSTSRKIGLTGKDARATRLSFVGELGWEISIPANEAAIVFDALIKVGAKPMGHYALDACRVEKGYFHWGHDLGPEITPLQAGLSWMIDWDKEFTGKTALLDQKNNGIKQRLCLLGVEGEPLVLHDEPIWENGKIVGLTTSGAKGARTGLILAIGLIDVAKGETKDATCNRKLEVEIAGELYTARALKHPPFDPAGRRMRA